MSKAGLITTRISDLPLADRIKMLEDLVSWGEEKKIEFINEQEALRSGYTRHYRYQEWKGNKESWVNGVIRSLGLLYNSSMNVSKFKTAGLKPVLVDEYDSYLTGFDSLLDEINKKTKFLEELLNEMKQQDSSAINKKLSIQSTTSEEKSQKRIIDGALIKIIENAKLKRICLEINRTPKQNVLSLSQSIEEALKWAVWIKAKENNTKLKEGAGLEALLNEAITKSYFKSNASIRFLKDFKSNFMKTAFDMVRHDENYVPDLTTLNPQIDALEQILRELYS